MKAWKTGMMVALVLFALPAVATAKPGFYASPSQRSMNFELSGTNGFRVVVGATSGNSNGPTQIFIMASRGQRERVQYWARGVATPNGTIKVKLPKVGRIAVRFDPTKVTQQAPPDNCRGRDSIVQNGVFRGTIELHGERGYTSVDTRGAAGSIVQTFRQVCDQRDTGTRGDDPAESFRQEVLLAGLRQTHQEAVGFSAYRFDFGQKLGGSRIFFVASAATLKRRFVAYHSVTVSGAEASFLTPQPIGSPGDVTVTPPLPFHGSALFHLESPKSSSWTGDLGVEIPGIGPVALAGSDFWSAFCADQKCTDTEPSNVQVGATGISTSF